MDGIGATIKNVIFRKAKSAQSVVYFLLEFLDAVTKFLPSIHFVYLPEIEKIFEPGDISMARNIDQTLKMQSGKKI